MNGREFEKEPQSRTAEFLEYETLRLLYQRARPPSNQQLGPAPLGPLVMPRVGRTVPMLLRSPAMLGWRFSEQLAEPDEGRPVQVQPIQC